jgi:hypothetical protein
MFGFMLGISIHRAVVQLFILQLRLPASPSSLSSSFCPFYLRKLTAKLPFRRAATAKYQIFIINLCVHWI